MRAGGWNPAIAQLEESRSQEREAQQDFVTSDWESVRDEAAVRGKRKLASTGVRENPLYCGDLLRISTDYLP